MTTRREQQAEIRRLNAERRRLQRKPVAVEKPTTKATWDWTDAPSQRPKRLSLSQIIEALLARGSREHSSVTISRNARGVPQFEVSVRTGDSEDVPDANAAYRKACELYEALGQTYPYPPEPDPLAGLKAEAQKKK